MNAEVGDRLVVQGRHLGNASRIGEIVEVHGADGAPPYVVRWEGEQATAVVIPGPDAHIEHRAQPPAG